MAEEEKRNFTRHRKCSNKVNLSIGKKSFGAEIIDDSVEGMGIIIVEDSHTFDNGMVVGLDINDPYEKTEGQIVWLKKSNSGTKIGIKKIGPLKGSLRNYRLADIFLGIQRSQRTGMLEVKSGTVLKRVYVKDGDMIFSSSNQDEDRFGDILLKEGRINQEQYDQSVEGLKKTGKRQGTVLVELGYLKPQELVWAVGHQVEEIIISLFSLEDGYFEFTEGPLPTDEVITLKLSAADLIYKGIKRIGELRKVKKLLQLSDDAVLRFSPDPLNLFQSIASDEKDKEILFYMDGKTSLKDILKLSSLREIETLKTIYAFLSARIIEVVEGRRSSDDIADITGREIFKGPEIKKSREVIARIEDIYSRYKSIGYYGILGLRENATQDEIKAAYYKVAKEFHPDRHFYLESNELKAKLNKIFSFITEAYTTLFDPERRIDYDKATHRQK